MTHDFPCVIPEVHKEKSTSSIGARPMSFARRIFLERSFHENKSDSQSNGEANIDGMEFGIDIESSFNLLSERRSVGFKKKSNY